jgi:hypothetical protein
MCIFRMVSWLRVFWWPECVEHLTVFSTLVCGLSDHLLQRDAQIQLYEQLLRPVVCTLPEDGLKKYRNGMMIDNYHLYCHLSRVP